MSVTMPRKPTQDPARPIAIYDLDLPALEDLLKAWGEPSYRAPQIWEWLYVHLVDAFSQMTNLPKSLRRRLSEEATIDLLEVVDTTRSPDGRTRKDLLQLTDGETIEAVLMRYRTRRTACLSTQVGCALGCPFCATGQMGFRRDLTSGEIVAQAVHFARPLQAEGNPLTNVVLMGMGEPLHNWTAVDTALTILNDPRGLGIGARKITVSTVGIVPKLRKLAERPEQFRLALSVHSADAEQRRKLMPVEGSFPLKEVLRVVQGFSRRVTFEYVMISGVNDRPKDIPLLAEIARPIGALVNLIPLHPGGPQGLPATRLPDIRRFAANLSQLGVSVTVRRSRGVDINAACGQLWSDAARSGKVTAEQNSDVQEQE